MIALATTSSSVATSILLSGQTTHSRFKILLNIEDLTTCNISKQSALAKLLQMEKIIIWDEAPISKRQYIESLDKIIQDINDWDTLFGNKVVVPCGDFHQVTLVIPIGTKEDIIDAS